MQFAETLSTLRKERNLKQTDLAELSGVSCATITFYETGRANPVSQSLIAIADAFSVSLDTLVGRGSDDTFPQILQALRVEHNISRAKLAKLSGIGEQTILRYEHGKSNPVSQPLLAIADALQVSLDELVGHEVKQAPCTDSTPLHPPEQLISKVMLLTAAQREEVEKYVDYVLSRC